MSQIIEEIHETFYTEVDRLLAEAGIRHSLETEKEEVLDRGNRLKALGFNQAKLVSEAEQEQQRLDKLKKENSEKMELIEAITYFSEKYPNYKFITEESVKKISSKYGLVYGEVGLYKGNVPEKNIEEIEKFKIDEEDELYIKETVDINNLGLGLNMFSLATISKKDIPTETKYPYNISVKFYKAPLEIVAPVADFDMTGKEVKDFKIQDVPVPDPIVLQPVIFNSKKYYLIVTAWGLESEDELVKL